MNIQCHVKSKPDVDSLTLAFSESLYLFILHEKSVHKQNFNISEQLLHILPPDIVHTVLSYAINSDVDSNYTVEQ